MKDITQMTDREFDRYQRGWFIVAIVVTVLAIPIASAIVHFAMEGTGINQSEAPVNQSH